MALFNYHSARFYETVATRGLMAMKTETRRGAMQSRKTRRRDVFLCEGQLQSGSEEKAISQRGLTFGPDGIIIS